LYKNCKIAVVVPAYNEERQISKVIITMPVFVDHIVIIDDASKDGTSAAVMDFAAKDSRIVLLRHEKNKGVGGAIATGYKWARDNSIDAAAVMAGDGQMHPEDLPALLDPVIDEGVHYAKGNRLIHRAVSDSMPTVRFLGNSILSMLTKIASGYWHIADSQTGYTVINKEALATIDWDQMYQRYGQPNDLLVTLNVFQMRVRDVPIQPLYNVGERSDLRIHRVLFTISMLLLRRFLWRMKERYIVRDFHPLVFFYALGTMLMLTTLMLFVRLIVLWIRNGEAPVLTAVAMMMLGSIGLQSIFFAMWFDMDTNRHLR
jgi:glycosyltransferase involved in cell wall biosynthesis